MTDKHASPNDNEAYFDLLAGHEVPDADPVTQKEAALVRQAALAQADMPQPSEFELERGWRQLQGRLEEAGVLESDEAGGDTSSQQQRTHKPLGPVLVLALAATVAGVLLVPQYLLPPDPVSKTFVIPQQVASTQPQADANALVEALQALEVATTLETVPDGWKVSASVLDTVSEEAVAAALQPFGLRLPPERQLEAIFQVKTP